MDLPSLDALAASPWVLPVLFAFVVGDAFLVVLPSETLVVALGALSASTGSPALWLVVPVAAAGAVLGDVLCYLIGRRVGLDRWRWQRGPRVRRALERASVGVHRRTAVLVFTARYVPFARIAVNLAAGAGRVPLRRYLPLSFAAGIAWACYNVAIGALVGAALGDRPLLATLVSIPVAIVLGLGVDRLVAALDARGARRTAESPAPHAAPGPAETGLTPPRDRR
ncbi:DedA family protein [Agromyces salentinus]|uniref:DedA family protein n=1 Tax=Agromyces salentinus TaxID=269421 RepID=A0ABN2N0L5_9MICO|nr:DedA family protein [Agromyces salentinus]